MSPDEAEPREVVLGQREGTELAALAWGVATAPPLLALHGWLDNAATFATIAPLLPDRHVLAPDLPGHGHSRHRPAGAGHHFVDWVADVLGAADQLGWEAFDLMGHSMGAGIATLLAGAFPDRVRRRVLLEGFGPLSAPAEETISSTRSTGSATFRCTRPP